MPSNPPTRHVDCCGVFNEVHLTPESAYRGRCRCCLAELVLVLAVVPAPACNCGLEGQPGAPYVAHLTCCPRYALLRTLGRGQGSVAA